jgi:hypothetical protein
MAKNNGNVKLKIQMTMAKIKLNINFKLQTLKITNPNLWQKNFEPLHLCNFVTLPQNSIFTKWY